MVQVKKSSMKGKNKQEQPKVTGLEIQDYVFDGLTPNKYSSKEEWLNTYREKSEFFFDGNSEIIWGSKTISQARCNIENYKGPCQIYPKFGHDCWK